MSACPLAGAGVVLENELTLRSGQQAQTSVEAPPTLVELDVAGVFDALVRVARRHRAARSGRQVDDAARDVLDEFYHLPDRVTDEPALLAERYRGRGLEFVNGESA